MDTKTKNMILNELIETCEDGILNQPINVLLRKFPQLSNDVVKATLYNLLQGGYISVCKEQTGFLDAGISVFPGGVYVQEYTEDLPLTDAENRFLLEKRILVNKEKSLCYLRKQEELSSAKRTKKRWDLYKWAVPLVLSAISLCLSAYAVLYKQH